MDPVTEVTASGQFHEPRVEITRVRERALKLDLQEHRCAVILAERQVLYREEAQRPQKSPNQDVVLISQPSQRWHISVADGVGGLPRGEWAAQQACRSLHDYVARSPHSSLIAKNSKPELRVEVETMLNQVNQEINQILGQLLGRGLSTANSPATTIVGALGLSPTQVLVYSVGDSMAAYVPKDTEQPLLYSEPHTTYEECIRSQAVNRTQALRADYLVTRRGTRMRDMLTSALGGGEGRLRKIFVSVLSICPGDQLFLFSDGLLKTVGRSERRSRNQPSALQLTEYGRPDALLEYLSHPAHSLEQLVDSGFRQSHDGPDQLLDDLAVVQLRLDDETTVVENRLGFPKTSRLRPPSQLMPEILPLS